MAGASWLGLYVWPPPPRKMDSAGDVVATFGGPFATTPDDVFADPFLDGPGGPKLRLMLLREMEAPASAAALSAARVRLNSVCVTESCSSRARRARSADFARAMEKALAEGY